MVLGVVRQAAALSWTVATMPARVAGAAFVEADGDARDDASGGGSGTPSGSLADLRHLSLPDLSLPDLSLPDLSLPDLPLEDLRRRVEDGAGAVGDVIEEGSELVGDALGSHRRVWEDADHGHAQIEVHGLEEPSAVGFRQRLAQAIGRLDQVRWAEVNAITGRVAVAFDGGESTLGALLELVE